MKTKFLMLLAAVLMMSGTMLAQEKKQQLTPEQRIEKRTERMQKKLNLDDATATKFAPIYKEYLKAKAECKVANKPCENPTDAQIKENIANRMKMQENAIKVEQKYYKKLSSVLTGEQLKQIFCKEKPKAQFGNKKGNFKKGNKATWQGKCPQFKPGCPMMKGEGQQFKGKCPQFKPGCPMMKGEGQQFKGKCPKFNPGCPMMKGEGQQFKGKCPKFKPGCPMMKGEGRQFKGKCPKAVNCPVKADSAVIKK